VAAVSNWNAETNVQIGAILTLVGERHPDATFSSALFRRKLEEGRLLSSASRAQINILGQNLRDRCIAKLTSLGIIRSGRIKVIQEGAASSSVLPARSAKPSAFINAWEEAVNEFVRERARLILLLRVNGYADLDFEELIRFHLDQGGPLTQAYGPDGSLDVAVVSTAALDRVEGSYRKLLSTFLPEQQRFFHDGYINRLNKPQDFRKLVEDGLTGQCEVRPVGTEIAEGLWCGSGAYVDGTVMIHGPAFIGAESRIGAGCVITGVSSIERGCHVDCGTTIEQSWLLQGAYVGVGLHVRRSIVGRNRLFHLDRNLEIAVTDRRLIRANSTSFLSGSTRLFLGARQVQTK
jgi:hypothetical protein